MKYDFTTVLDRAGKDSLAADVIPFENIEVEEGRSRIPMWVADMSFPTAPFIVDAMRARLNMPNFGYFMPSEEYYYSIIRWHRERKGDAGIRKENIGYENGVLGGVSSAVRAFSSQGDSILVHAPTYVGFTGVLTHLGRKIVHSELETDENGVWRMNFSDMDRKIRENRIHLVIFCSPHNPCGRVWERWEIEEAMAVFARNDCIVLSDEIWSDLILPGHTHIPTQSVSEDAKNRTIAFYAPSKTFSLAGLVGSYHIVYNSLLGDRICREAEITHYNAMNVLSMHALTAAYSSEGAAWTDELLQVLDGNLRYACSFIRENFPGVKCMLPEGTYMLYLDCADWCAAHGVSIEELQSRGVRKGVIWQNGEAFCRKNTIRMNLALPFSLEEEAFNRLKREVFV